MRGAWCMVVRNVVCGAGAGPGSVHQGSKHYRSSWNYPDSVLPRKPCNNRNPNFSHRIILSFGFTHFFNCAFIFILISIHYVNVPLSLGRFSTLPFDGIKSVKTRKTIFVSVRVYCEMIKPALFTKRR